MFIAETPMIMLYFSVSLQNKSTCFDEFLMRLTAKSLIGMDTSNDNGKTLNLKDTAIWGILITFIFNIMLQHVAIYLY